MWADLSASAQGGPAKCVIVPIAANVCLVSVGQLADIEKMPQDPAEETQLPLETPTETWPEQETVLRAISPGSTSFLRIKSVTTVSILQVRKQRLGN